MLLQPVGLSAYLHCISYIGKLKREQICSEVLVEEWEHMEPPSHKDTAAFLSAAYVLFYFDHETLAGTQTRAPMGTAKVFCQFLSTRSQLDTENQSNVPALKAEEHHNGWKLQDL